jgi:hypothetical protein
MTAFAVVNLPHVHLTLENKSHTLDFTVGHLRAICVLFMASYNRTIAREY